MNIDKIHDDLIKLQELSEMQAEALAKILEIARNGLKILGVDEANEIECTRGNIEKGESDD
jgi:hypothetical protein